MISRRGRIRLPGLVEKSVVRSNRDDFEKQLGVFVAIAISRIPPSPPMAKRSWADTREKRLPF